MNFVILGERMIREASGHTRKQWLAKCSCGHTTWRGADNIQSGKSTKCRSCSLRVHGLSNTPEYAAWRAMLHRCTNPKSKFYKDYGARDITVSDDWKDFNKFLSDMGSRPAGLELERVNNDLGYSKENCVWATRAEQMANTRMTRKIEYKNKTQSLSAWARDLGISAAALWYRVNSGWAIERAFTTPISSK